MANTNFNYIKENYKEFTNMIYDTLDRLPINDKEARNNFRNYTLPDYIAFLYNLQFLQIDKLNPLDSQQEFCNKLFLLCDRVKKDGLENTIPQKNVEHFCTTLQTHMKDWAHNDLDNELKKQERVFYSQLAFSKEDNPSQQYANRIAQLKNQINKNW